MKTTARMPFFLGAALLLVACEPAPAPEIAAAPAAAAVATAEITAVAETATVGSGGANDAATMVDSADPARSLVVAAEETGIGLYSADGARVGGRDDIAATQVETRAAFMLDGKPVALVIANHQSDGTLHALVLDRAARTLQPVSAQPVATDAEVTGLCLYPSPRTGSLYAFAVSEPGLIRQFEIFDAGSGTVGMELIRTLHAGFGAGHCVVDADNGALYLAEETVGIWRIDAEPESDPERHAVDLVAPRGRLGEEVKGLTVFHTAPGQGWLVASDASENRLALYDLDGNNFVGYIAVAAGPGADGLEEAEGLHADATWRSDRLPAGMLVAADDDNDGESTNYKLLSWADIASGLKLPAPGVAQAGDIAAIANVLPAAETDPVDDFGDAADDPAIWVHPEDPQRSVIIGAQKQRGLYVYDLSGKTLQVVPDGRMNNVDLRTGFPFRGRTIDIVAASNRTNRAITVYAFDGARQRIGERLADIPTGLAEPYGLCLYHSAKTGAYHAFVNDTDGRVQQWQLAEADGGKLGYRLVREFRVESQPEGCVADDEAGILYLGEEAVGVWKFSAEPDGGDARTVVDKVDGGHLVADVEGMALWYGPKGTGYLLVSCQGDSHFAVYRREGANDFVGHFRVVANPAAGIDGVSETDGLDVTSAPLGKGHPRGVFVAQDGRNVMPAQRQNFKIVDWAAVEAALALNPAAP